MQNRAALRARVFPLAREPRDDLIGHTSAAQRLALVADLTREMWALAGLKIPDYARAEMPVVVRSLANREE